MDAPLRLRIHVSEPFDFERENGTAELLGSTLDHLDEAAEEWHVALDNGFTFNDEPYREMLVSPRYMGEHLARVRESIVGFPVRLAHRSEDGWYFAMTGMISLAPPPNDGRGAQEPKEDLI